jgi:hypothetical protein
MTRRRVLRRKRAAQTPADAGGAQKPAPQTPAAQTRSADGPPVRSPAAQTRSADGPPARGPVPQTTPRRTRRHPDADAPRRSKPTRHRRANRLANRRRTPPIRGHRRSSRAHPAVAGTPRVRRRPAATATKFPWCPTYRSGPVVARPRGAGRPRAPAHQSPRRTGRRVASGRATTPPSRIDRRTRRYRSAPICPRPTSAAATPGRTWRRGPRPIVTPDRVVWMAGRAATDRATCPSRVPDGAATADAITPWTVLRPTRQRRPISPVESAIGRRTTRSRRLAGSRRRRRCARRRCLRRHRPGRLHHRPGRP